ncbi:hypothetical protein C2E23DRAFT_855807 [Lenzites betulinus]|nr:hypothetical protein C2E23DRAFT_855807 [Lenzites betulinus]
MSGTRAEELVTDHIDRYGRPIPGKPQVTDAEEERSRKRARQGPPAPPSPKAMSIRFRKYKPLPPPKPERRRPSPPPTDQIIEWLDRVEPPQCPTPPENANATHRAITATNANPPRTPPTRTHHLPSPHLRDEDYTDTRARMRRHESAGHNARRIDAHDPQPMEIDPIAPEATTRVPTNNPLLSPPLRDPAGAHVAQYDENVTRNTYWSQGANATDEAPRPIAAVKPQARVLPAVITTSTQNPPPATPGRRPQSIAEQWAAAAGGMGVAAMRTPSQQAPPATAMPVSPLTFTQPPRGGFPCIHQAHPEGLIEGLEPTRVHDLWDEELERSEGPPVLITTYNQGYPKPGQVGSTTSDIARVIKEITKESGFVVIPPEPQRTSEGTPLSAPKAWVIRKLSPTAINRILSQPVWSCDLITIMVHDRSLELPTYLATFGGYAHNSEDTITTTIRAAFASAPILPYIKELVSANPEYHDVGTDEAAEAILGTLRVDIRALTNGNYTAAVYCASPTASGAKWAEWKSFIASLTFMSRVNPPARARLPERCEGCHGSDHATRDCPFQEIQGWNPPDPGAASTATPAPYPPLRPKGRLARTATPKTGAPGSKRGPREEPRGEEDASEVIPREMRTSMDTAKPRGAEAEEATDDTSTTTTRAT